MSADAVAWTFSTGVLRGHEGSPLVIGDMMYVHAPFPNTVFALDLSKEGQIVWNTSEAGRGRHSGHVL
jgi:glucose dehydrogenase